MTTTSPDEDRALALHEEAASHDGAGRFTEAEGPLRRALALSEEALGASHPRTAAIRNGLGMLCKCDGRFGEAEALYRRALAAKRELFGDGHIDTAITASNLAALVAACGEVLVSVRA